MPLTIGMSPRDRRTLLVGVTSVGSIVGIGRALPALLAWQRAQVEQAANLTQDLQAAEREERAVGTIRDSVRARSARLARYDSSMLSAGSASAASAALASSLADLADAAPIKVSSMQLRADSAAPGSIAPVAVRVTGTTDVKGLGEFLRAVEGGEVPLMVRELAVTQPEPNAPDNKIESLRVDILVEGLARITAATSARP
ncbi:MAG TPA: GspMb/PilO family protein [Gemmatimonadaceae bacterium]|jgi:hypothetical protein|nr:GspMb/PilO family protein [Gemmatimonadaceae bacterium]